MAIIHLCGWESGDSVEAAATAGTFSVQATTKRTGGYALRVNPTASSNSNHLFAGIAATGLHTTSTVLPTTYFLTCYIRVATLPSANGSTILRCGSGTTIGIEVHLDTNGAVYLHNGTSASTTIATLSTNTWYRLMVKLVQSGTCEGSIDGGTAQTLTGGAASAFVYLGTRTVTVTYDIYYDDLCIDDAAYPGAGQVFRMDPDGNGNYTAWTGTSVDVDDIPHNSDTDYITASVIGTAETVTLESAATAGLVGSPLAIKSLAVARTTAGGTSFQLRTRSGTTDDDTTSAAQGNSYTALMKVYDTDPADAAEWTSGKLDALEVGADLGADGVDNRCTTLCVMVWEDGVAVGGGEAVKDIIGMGIIPWARA